MVLAPKSIPMVLAFDQKAKEFERRERQIVAQTAELLAQGLEAWEVILKLRHLGCKRYHVRRAEELAGPRARRLQRRHQRKGRVRPQVQEALWLYTMGLTAREVAQEVGLSAQAAANTVAGRVHKLKSMDYQLLRVFNAHARALREALDIKRRLLTDREVAVVVRSVQRTLALKEVPDG